MGKNNLTGMMVFMFLVSSALGLIAQSGEKTAGDYLDYNNIQMPESPIPGFKVMGGTEVNLAKGNPIIEIPLYTFVLDGVEVPIAISYDASGIKVGQRASSVGLGWNLRSGGAINRSIRGWPDENPGIWGWYNNGFLDDDYYSVHNNPNDDWWQRVMKGIPQGDGSDGLANLVDHNPDLFNYSFLGYSGSFVNDTEMNIIKEREDGITVGSLGTPDEDLWANDLKGNRYWFDFGDAETSNNVNTTYEGGSDVMGSRNWEGELGFYPATAWNLSSITTKNNKIIDFEYEDVNLKYTIERISSSITLGMDCDNDYSYPHSPIKKVNFTTTEYDIKSKQIKKISSLHSNIEISFSYVEDTGLPNWVQTSRLTEIIVSNSITNTRKIFYFEYDRYAGDPRLKLTSVKEVSVQNGLVFEKPPYSFSYEQGVLPAQNSKSTDLYGYYNAASNGPNSVPWMDIGIPAYQGHFNQHSANRSLNTNSITNGVLNKIQYPTGGYTEFHYESNLHNNKYYGGLRVFKIEDQSETGTYNTRLFQYDDPEGRSLGDHLNLFVKKEGDNGAKSYHSSPIRGLGDLTEGFMAGFFYGKVTVTSILDNKSFKTEYIYGDNPYNNRTYEPVLLSHRSKDASNRTVKITEYQYEKVGKSKNFIWNTLGDMVCYYHNRRTRTIWLGYSTTPRKVQFSGNYAYLPTRIATTDFPEGGTSSRLTVVKDITYDSGTLLKKTETTDLKRRRDVDSNGAVSYPVNDANAERITVDYTYAFEVVDYDSLPNFPKSTVVKQVVTTEKDGDFLQTSGKAYAFDNYGNIKTIYDFEKGQGSNHSTLSYVPTDYEERTSFIFRNGFPVQVRPRAGIYTSYIWNKKGNVPVAKIEGILRGALDQNLVTQLENADFGQQLAGLLGQLRTALSNQAIKNFLTTYNHTPLAGVETITDPKGDKATYEYDPFGRLQFVRDADGNILSETEYNYASD